jgi:polyisoprenoid-binding protein YceI
VSRFRIDPERSSVVIDASSSVHPIHSRTQGVEGFVDLESRQGELSLDVDRLRSGNPLEDRELKRRIDARRFPTIVGRLTELHDTDVAGRYRVVGEITFRGVTRICEDDMTFTILDDGTLQIGGTTTFDIRDWGMEPPRILVLRVHPEVTVTLDAVAVREAAQ